MFLVGVEENTYLNNFVYKYKGIHGFLTTILVVFSGIVEGSLTPIGRKINLSSAETDVEHDQEQDYLAEHFGNKKRASTVRWSLLDEVEDVSVSLNWKTNIYTLGMMRTPAAPTNCKRNPLITLWLLNLTKSQ